MYKAICNEMSRIQLVIEQTEKLLQDNNDFNADTIQSLEYEIAEMRNRINKLSTIKYWLEVDNVLTDRINETIEKLEGTNEDND